MNSNTRIRKILILVANPNGLRVDIEVREVEEGIRRAIKRDQFDIRTRWAVRPIDIRRAIMEEKPQVVHFCGHGTTNGRLVLEDDSGQQKPVQPEVLAKLFSLHIQQVECVLLNACYTKNAAEAISQHIDYAIGMNQAIGDKTAIAFAIGFYDALVSGEDYERAFQEGVVSSMFEELSEEKTPVLKKKANRNSTDKNLGISNESSQLQIPSNPTIKIFYSYSHKDEELRDELEKHLSILKRRNVITGWHDRKIGAGSEWKGDIDSHLNEADVILLLISSDFIDSDYCWDVELKRVMERHLNGKARVIPVILRPCHWEGASFGKLQALPKNAQPVTSWENRDAAFEDIARSIQAVVEGLQVYP